MLTADRIAEILRRENIDAECNVPLKDYVTFRIGGPCHILVKPKSLSEIQRAVTLSKGAGLDYWKFQNPLLGWNPVVGALPVRLGTLVNGLGICLRYSGKRWWGSLYERGSLWRRDEGRPFLSRIFG